MPGLAPHDRWLERTILSAVRRLADLLAAIALVTTAGACGSPHRAHLSANDRRVRIAPYRGHVYPVREVKRAFAALGLELHRGATPAPGLVSLLNDTLQGPQRIPRPPRYVTVVVTGDGESTQVEKAPNTEVTRYANITVLSQPDARLQVRSAVSALRWGTVASLGPPRRGFIVLGSSIDGIRLDESRADVEKAFGAGRTIRRGVVSYFGGHLVVNYWFHDGLYKWVTYLETRWSGYRTRSGVHVGSSGQELGRLYVTCAQWQCALLAGPAPDPVGTEFTLRHGKVFDITIGRLG